MVKIETFEDSHFMPQAVRVRLTDHTGSTFLSWHASLILKSNRTLVLCRRAIALVW